MLSKAHLTSHSRMFGSRWVITPSWLSGLWRSFLYSSYIQIRLLLKIFSENADWEEPWTDRLFSKFLRLGIRWSIKVDLYVQVAPVVKTLPANAGTRGVWSLGWEDPWRRKWQPPPVFLPRESHGQRSLAGCRPWGCKSGPRLSAHTLLLCVHKSQHDGIVFTFKLQIHTPGQVSHPVEAPELGHPRNSTGPWTPHFCSLSGTRHRGKCSEMTHNHKHLTLSSGCLQHGTVKVSWWYLAQGKVLFLLLSLRIFSHFQGRKSLQFKL